MLRLIHNLACKVRLVRLVAPCSADSTLAHQVSLVHRAGASAAWHYKLDMNSLRASLLLPLPLSCRFAVAADRSPAPQCLDAINHPLNYLGRSQAEADGRTSAVADAIGMRTSASQLAPINNQIFIPDRTTFKPAFQDFPGSSCVAGLG